MRPACACRPLADGLQLSVRVTPRAGMDAVVGLDRRDGAAPALQLRVAAAPSDGQANAAVIRLVAGLLKQPASRVRIIGGEHGRQKLLFVEGDGESLARTCMETLNA